MPVLDALLELGKAYALLDPVATITEGDEPLNCFLDTLWQAQDQAALKKGADEFKAFLKRTNSLSLPRLKFQIHLLKAVKSATILQEQIHNPKFLSAVVKLGGAYAALNPSPVTPENEPPNCFLYTLWQAQNAADIQKGADELSSSVVKISNDVQLIDYQAKLLTALKMVPAFENALSDPSFVDSILDLATDYVRFKEASTNTETK
ncbi:hypothetical protein [Leptolyngbya sp. 7M]|uniref:hypothetical protein n=1 Tax=Leptolyngbya sp. 7M TaxID=2812896 RepID=UPI001B8C2662|nr:hypothetical protein [Leptolyngbya sp. 7M]QYO67772.1 hypothetical protein JVX88_13865 [Leptolyngbya sp. 7M]